MRCSSFATIPLTVSVFVKLFFDFNSDGSRLVVAVRPKKYIQFFRCCCVSYCFAYVLFRLLPLVAYFSCFTHSHSGMCLRLSLHVNFDVVHSELSMCARAFLYCGIDTTHGSRLSNLNIVFPFFFSCRSI